MGNPAGIAIGAGSDVITLSVVVGGVTFSASALNLTYTSASGNTPDEFTVTGAASHKIGI